VSGRLIPSQSEAAGYTIVFVTRSYETPSTAAALLQLARLKGGMTQRELALRAGVPATMISAYERDKRQPTLETLLRLLRAAGFELRMQLEPYDPHDDVLAALEDRRPPRERARRDRQIEAWRQATGIELAEAIGAKEATGKPGDLRILPLLYREQALRTSA
jgi:transcriptional regulator with XRE-family HTH domain